MDSDESKPAVTPSNMPRYVKEFEATYFWRRVMLPTMQAAILSSMDRMIYVDDERELRRLQTTIQTLQVWSAFPKRKHKEAVDDAEFEADKNREEKKEEIETD